MERLDKWLCAQTALSRRDAASSIRRGRVTVNGQAVRDPAVKVDAAADTVALDGKPVCYRKHLYIMMNKPVGVICATHDDHDKTVIDLLDEDCRARELFPAGRLDKDTTGMVLITDDGDFAHRMLAPKKHVPKQYLVTLDAPADEAVVNALGSGMTLANGDKCQPAECEPLDGNRARVTLHEGKYHQVKRMFAAAGRHVEALHRLSMGGLPLDPALGFGEWKMLDEETAMGVFFVTE